MSTESVFVLLFAIATAVAIAVRRLRVPYTAGLVLAGLLLGAVHILPAPQLTKSLLFTVFLPGLLFEAAFHLEFTEFWRNRLTITSLAVPGVVAATALTALILAPVARALGFGEGFDWRYALVFGALIAATDPIAVVALFRSLGAPRRLSVLVEGESLFNDGTGIVFFTLSLTIVGGGPFTFTDLALQFVEIVGIGALIGMAVGLVVSQVLRRMDDPMIEITLTTIAAYGSFVTAEHFHYSGVIATVTAGMLCGNYSARAGMAPSTRVAVESFWEYVAFALNSMVFLLIGFEVDLRALLASWPVILVAYLVVTLVRGLVIAGGMALLGRTRERFPLSWSAVLFWGGLRGALPMVLALSLPATFAHRDLIVRMTFGVAVISILGQGLTMEPLLRRLGFGREQEERADYELGRASVHGARAALAELDRLEQTHFADAAVLSELRDEYRERLHDAEQRVHRLHVKHESLRREELDVARRHLLAVEKSSLIDAFHQGVVSREVYERLLGDLDARLLELESGQGSGSERG
jgi:CPA1 family monovalent cation:H+ antiporter